MTVQAIPTPYRGVAFRSRLEARTAAALDRARIPFAYEPEAFAMPDGRRYLPDFRLTAANVWLEVKPNWETIRLDDKAQSLACHTTDRVFYVYPRRVDGTWVDALSVVTAKGGAGRIASAIWTACPVCHVRGPWTIGDEAPSSCCQGKPASEDRWDAAPLFGPLLPQYQDGDMLPPRVPRGFPTW
jgi:hypothetical protein